jgi:steroid delta-isomerase-like uncharacterized protein
MTNPSVTVARRWFEEVWNQKRTETIHELLTEESVCQSEAGILKGPGPFREQVHAPFLHAFPDLQVTVEGTVAEGDQVVVRWRATGTHTGEGMGLAPTGRRVSFRGMTWIRCREGKMMEGWDCWNQTGLFRALQEGQASPSVALS